MCTPDYLAAAAQRLSALPYVPNPIPPHSRLRGARLCGLTENKLVGRCELQNLLPIAAETFVSGRKQPAFCRLKPRASAAVHSALSAFAGSMAAARCAGMMLARKAATASAATEPSSTIGSQPFTW